MGGEHARTFPLSLSPRFSSGVRLSLLLLLRVAQSEESAEIADAAGKKRKRTRRGMHDGNSQQAAASQNSPSRSCLPVAGPAAPQEGILPICLIFLASSQSTTSHAAYCFMLLSSPLCPDHFCPIALAFDNLTQKIDPKMSAVVC